MKAVWAPAQGLTARGFPLLLKAAAVWALLTVMVAMGLSMIGIKNGPYGMLALAIGIVWFAATWFYESTELDRLRKALPDHAATLAARRAALLRPNEYGITDRAGWEAEKDRFLAMLKIDHKSWIYPSARTLVEQCAASTIHNREPNSGTAFEAQCQEILDRHGWTTWLTKPTGDHGVDIVAIRDGMKVAIQCKNYASDVGSRAVQEIISGREYEKADYAAVVSNAGYTRHAIDLAASIGVLLLNEHELETLYERLV